MGWGNGVAEPSVTAVRPINGPWVGGTVVTVTGAQFVATPHLRCEFNGSGAPPVFATYITGSVLRCVSPAAASANASSTLRVSNNAQDYTTDAVVFSYYGTPPLARVAW